MEVDYKVLKEGLNKLTGYDFQDAETACRKLGDQVPEISLSKNFQATLAAKCLGVTKDDLLALPIKDYTAVTGVVFSFLLGTLAEQTRDV